MTLLRKHFSLTAGALAATLFLAACGGGDAESPPNIAPPVVVPGDTTAPTLTITDNVTDATLAGPVTFTFNFSEDIGSTFGADDIVVTGGSAGAFTLVSGTQATLVVTPTGASGTINVSVAAGAFADAAGNASVAAVSASQEFGATTPPPSGSLVLSFDESPEAFVDLGAYGGALPTVETGPAGGTGKALKIVKPAGGEVWGGVFFTTAAKIPFTADKKSISARVYSSKAGAVITFKVQVSETDFVEVAGTPTGAANTWGTVTWDFSAVSLSKNYNVVAITPDNTAATNGQSYFIDEITVVAGTVTPPPTGSTVLSFDESPEAFSDLGAYGGALPTVEAGPTGGTGKALKIVKPAGGEVWGGIFFTTAKIPFATDKKVITARVQSSRAGAVLKFKVEIAGGANVEVAGTPTGAANTWSTVTWDFSAVDLTKNYTVVAITPDGELATSGVSYFVDDIKVVAGGTPPVVAGSTLATFDETTALAFSGFGGADETTTVETGPSGGTGKALKIVRPGGEVYAGAIVTTGNIGFTADRKTITARVHSSKAGVPIALKVEGANGLQTAVAQATSAVVAGWQTLTWILAPDLSKTYDKVTLLPDLDTVGTGQTYYFDDIKLAEASVSAPLSYIAQPFVEYSQSAYDTASAKARTGNYATGNYSAPGMTQWWGGAFKSKIQIGFGVSKNNTAQDYFGLYIANGGSGWDISAATKYSFNIGTNGECAGKCSANVRMVSVTNPSCVADATVLLRSAAPVPYSKNLSDFTVSGCATNTMAAFKAAKVAELHFQMLRAGMQFTAGGDGPLFPNGLDMGDSIAFDAPTGAPATAIDPVVTGPAFTRINFDDPAVVVTSTSFEGATASITNGPVSGDSKALKVNKVTGAAPWAGVTISTKPNFAIDKIPFTPSAKKMSLKVWAPAAGMKIRMKVEDATDVTHNCETDATTTVANGWQTLTFDFNVRAFNNGDPNQITSNRCADNALLQVSVMNKVTVFPNIGTAGEVVGNFYFDDLKFVP